MTYTTISSNKIIIFVLTLIESDNMEDEIKYEIKCNGKQLSVIAEALEMYSRHLAGQFDKSFLPPTFEAKILWKKEIDRDEIYRLLAPIKRLLFPEIQRFDDRYEYSGLGIHNKELAEESRIAYSIYDEIRFERSDKNVRWGNRTPENFSDVCPRIEIKTINGQS